MPEWSRSIPRIPYDPEMGVHQFEHTRGLTTTARHHSLLKQSVALSLLPQRTSGF